MAAVAPDIRDAFFDEIYSIASKDRDVIFMTADADAFSLRRYKQDFPSQFVNVGVAEQNMVAVAAGLALCGKKVFIYALIPFLTMRCYEQIKVNVCSMNLPVTMIGAGSGLSFTNDGPTHAAIQDIAVMRILPELTILNPADSRSAAASAQIAYKSTTPTYVRIDKGQLPNLYDDADNFSDGLKVIKPICETNIISSGFMSHRAVEVANDLDDHCVPTGVIDLSRLKPINGALLEDIACRSKSLITVEENSIVGGVGTIVSELLTDHQIHIPLKRIALRDKQHFDYGSREWIHKLYRLDKDSIVQEILAWAH